MSLASLRRAVAVAVVLGLATGGAHAEPTGRAAREARAHLAAADRAFKKARYDEALAQVQAAYAADPRPEFLIVFAQVYRAMGQPRRAVEACELYLSTAPDGARAAEARALAQAAQQEVDAAKPPEATATAPTVAEPVAAAAKVEPVVAVSVPPAALAVAPAPRRRRTPLVVGVTVGAAVVVGAALGFGLGFGLHHGLPHVSFQPPPKSN